MARLGKLAMITGARRWAKRNADTVHSGVDKVAGAVSQRVGAKHSGRVDSGASMAKKLLTGSGGGGARTGQAGDSTSGDPHDDASPGAGSRDSSSPSDPTAS